MSLFHVEQPAQREKPIEHETKGQSRSTQLPEISARRATFSQGQLDDRRALGDKNAVLKRIAPRRLV
jgi:hypothetical protein